MEAKNDTEHTLLKYLEDLQDMNISIESANQVLDDLAYHDPHVSSRGETAARQYGTVNFGATAKLIVNGNVQENVQLNDKSGLWDLTKSDQIIGSGKLKIPKINKNDKVQLEINSGYDFSGNEGRAVPLPPYTKKTFNLDIKE